MENLLFEDLIEKDLVAIQRNKSDTSLEFHIGKPVVPHAFYTTIGNYQISEDLKHTKVWKSLFRFQKEGVKYAISQIHLHNGFIYADGTGLGKTLQALAIAKYFEMQNKRVLVLCPKKINKNWLMYLDKNKSPLKEDGFQYVVLNHSDLTRIKGMSNGIDLLTFDWDGFDLVIVDESHHFRNNTSKSKSSRYNCLMEKVIKQGDKTAVLLLSATPVNNNFIDLYNQVSLIAAGDDTAFAGIGIDNIRKTIKSAQEDFSAAVKEGQHSSFSNKGLSNILGAISIARSRKQIERDYENTTSEIGGFAKREKPVSIHYEIDSMGAFPQFSDIERQIAAYKLSVFNPTKYLKSEFQSWYEDTVKNFSQAEREHHLIGMIKILFLKRMESSIVSFSDTMRRTIAKIDELIQKIINFEDIDFDYGDDFDALSVGKKSKFKLAHLDRDRWLRDLQSDRQQLVKLYNISQEITPQRDGKLQKLRELILNKVNHPTINANGKKNKKVLIFTAFSDTAKYLYDELKDKFGVHCGLVTGTVCKSTFGKNNPDDILMNFSPDSKNRDSQFFDEEIDVLIATDCISEGQNLQDCDYVVNYDIHWNPVRLVQRFGRIDRIKSKNSHVYMFNFWATNELDEYLGLRSRVESRMVSLNFAATCTDNILQDDCEQSCEQSDELNHRDQQLKRMQSEILDLEEFNQVNLSNLSSSSKGVPFMDTTGIYSVVLARPSLNIHKGAIFCVQQNDLNCVNKSHQIHLVYIQDDGNCIVDTKLILDMLKRLCVGIQTQPSHTMYNTTHYKRLLEKSIKVIKQKFVNETAPHIDAVSLVHQNKSTSVFNLISCLIIK